MYMEWSSMLLTMILVDRNEAVTTVYYMYMYMYVRAHLRYTVH